MIEETSHVIGKSQSMSEEGARMDEETGGDEGELRWLREVVAEKKKLV